MLLLDPSQLVEERVVFVVADLGVVEDVVAVVVVGDLAPQLRGALCRIPRAHFGGVATDGLRRDTGEHLSEDPLQIPVAQPRQPGTVGQVEVNGRDRDALARDGGEVRSRLVLE